jgi:uncharacterized protein (DUF924 family)
MTEQHNDLEAAHELIEFWFSDKAKKRWFKSTLEFDNELRNKYAGLYQAACRGELEHWRDNVESALALVILFDQIPLNIFRGRPQSFASDGQARDVATAVITHGWDKSLSDEQKVFLYMPFMHSEALADQDHAVELYRAAGLEHNLRYAKHHREIVHRFGRFPHRNAILERPSTHEELDWLASKDAFKG